jgi:hypothetical protein
MMIRSMELLPEDRDERRMFDESSKIWGGSLRHTATTLAIWGATFPQDGSMAKMCNIMSNEIRKAINEKIQ